MESTNIEDKHFLTFEPPIHNTRASQTKMICSTCKANGDTTSFIILNWYQPYCSKNQKFVQKQQQPTQIINYDIPIPPFIKPNYSYKIGSYIFDNLYNNELYKTIAVKTLNNGNCLFDAVQKFFNYYSINNRKDYTWHEFRQIACTEIQRISNQKKLSHQEYIILKSYIASESYFQRKSYARAPSNTVSTFNEQEPDVHGMYNNTALGSIFACAFCSTINECSSKEDPNIKNIHPTKLINQFGDVSSILAIANYYNTKMKLPRTKPLNIAVQDFNTQLITANSMEYLGESDPEKDFSYADNMILLNITNDQHYELVLLIPKKQ